MSCTRHITRTALLTLLAALPACYNYRVVPMEQVPVGASVRARISATEAEKLGELIGSDERVLEGSLLEKPDSGMLIAVSSVVGVGSGTVQRAQQRVAIPRGGLLEVEIRQLNRWKTIGVSALAVGVITYVATVSLSAEKSDGGDGKPNPNDSRHPYTQRSIRLLSIPLGWRR